MFAYEYCSVQFYSISKFYTNAIEVGQLQFTGHDRINEKQLKVIIKEFQ